MSVPTHLPHQQPSPIAVSMSLTTPNSLMTSTPVLLLLNLPAACPTCSTHFFKTLNSLLDHHAPLLTKTNKSSRTAPAPWITTEILSLKSACRRLERTYIASHSIFYLKLFQSATNRYHKFIAAAKSHSTSHLSSPPHLNLELFGKLSLTSYTELQIALYPHHSLWLPYHSHLPHTSLIKSQSNISPYKPTPLPPQLFLCHLQPRLYSTLSILPHYTKSTIYSLNHLIDTVILILFLPLY